VITLSKHYCPDCLDTCWYAYDHATGQHVHVDDHTAYTARLIHAGYYYAGHSGSEYRYRESHRLAAVTPLPLDWQMSLDEHVHVHELEVNF
jgi:hypothetical protein